MLSTANFNIHKITMYRAECASESSDSETESDFENRPIEGIILQQRCDEDFERLLEGGEDPNYIEELELRELRRPWGLEKPIYVQFKETFPSAKKYRKEVVKVLVFHEDQVKCEEEDLVTNITEYFKQSYLASLEDAEVVEGGLPPLASTTLRSVLSMISKFWKYTGRGDFKLAAPLIVDRLASWDKQHVTKKSKTLTTENLSE
jgi:hypothetical protein